MTTVFVSSTCYDLVDVRAELHEHLRDLGLTALLSDRPSSDFVAEGRGDSVETCLVNLRKADVVLFVLSQRYGSPVPGYDGLSATHVEYREAVEHKKPMFMYVRDRLASDYGVWKKAPDTKDFPWVKKGNEGLFPLLHEHETRIKAGDVGPDVTSNWYWPFVDSVDLKRRVSGDLKRQANAARLARLIEAGKVPTMRVRPANVRRSEFMFRVRAIGGPAFDVEIDVPGSEEPYRYADLSFDGSEQTGELRVSFGDASRPTPETPPRQFTVTVRFTTIGGDRVEDRIAMQYTPVGTVGYRADLINVTRRLMDASLVVIE